MNFHLCEMPKIEKPIWLSGDTAWYTLAIYKPLTMYSLGIPTQQLTLGTGQSLVTSFKSRCNTKYSRIQNSRLHMVNAKKPVLILPFSIKCNDSSRQIRFSKVLSVTRWLYYFFKIWPYRTIKNCPKLQNICQSRFTIMPNAI